MKKKKAAKRRTPKKRKRARVSAITLQFTGSQAERLRAWAKERKTTPRRYAVHVLFPPAAIASRQALERRRTTPMASELEADDVKLAAFAPDVARFHDDRAFIGSIYDFLLRIGKVSVPLGEFKRRLVELHRAGLLRLTRADLVGAMDPAQVERSETKYMGTTFHFVALDR